MAIGTVGHIIRKGLSNNLFNNIIDIDDFQIIWENSNLYIYILAKRLYIQSLKNYLTI